MLCKVTRCAGRVSANTRPHQLRWGDREMGTAISCTECSQVAGLIQKSVETPRKHRLFVQLFFVQLSFVRRSYVAIDRRVLFCVRARAYRGTGGTGSIVNKAQGKQCKANSACLKAVCA